MVKNQQTRWSQTGECDTDFFLPRARPEILTRLDEEFKHRIKAHALLPCIDTAAIPYGRCRRLWALPASGRSTMRRGDGWESLGEKPYNQTIDFDA